MIEPETESKEEEERIIQGWVQVVYQNGNDMNGEKKMQGLEICFLKDELLLT